jgi:hypothetical protein
MQAEDLFSLYDDTIRRLKEASGAVSDLEIQVSILGPALLAGLDRAVDPCAGWGSRCLARGIVFIDLAIAQIAGLGVTLAGSFLEEPLGLSGPGCCGVRGSCRFVSPDPHRALLA